MDTVLVTCMYHTKYTEPVGGRGYPINTYFPSLKNILNLKLPLIIYTSLDSVSEITKFLQVESFTDYEIRTYELTNFRHYDRILQLKDKYVNPDYRFFHRCEVLCHSKLFFVEQSYNNKWNKTNVVWIDAGITEVSKIAKTYGGVELGEQPVIDRYIENYYPTNTKNMFNPDLGVSINNIVTKIGWFHVKLNSPPAEFNSPWKDILINQCKKHCNAILDDSTCWVVGTVWGGNKKNFDELYSMYNKMLDETVNTEMFPRTEEMYFSVINACLGKFTFEFDTWYHDIPGDIEYLPEVWQGNNKPKSFYKVFLDMHTHK